MSLPPQLSITRYAIDGYATERHCRHSLLRHVYYATDVTRCRHDTLA